MSRGPEISIIIRTYNEEKYLRECLDKVFNQKINKTFEVIIVDSQSTDSTLTIAQKYHTRILSVNKKDFTYGNSLNIGCSNARGKYLVFLSAHAIAVNEIWLQELMGSFDENTAGVSGKQIPMHDANPLIRRFILDSKDKSFRNTNSAIKKRFWKIQHFDETLLTAEDISWSRFMVNKGYLIKYNPHAVVYHSHNDSLGRFFKRNYAELKENINKNKFPIYFRDSLHNLADDIRYVIKKKENIFWLFYSFVLFVTRILVLIKVYVNNVK